jgi:Ribbon-helix-helix protein, copG family
MPIMRTRLTVDQDLAELLRERARATGSTVSDIANQAIRTGLSPVSTEPSYHPRVHSLGIRPGVNVTKALQLVGQLDDDELARINATH